MLGRYTIEHDAYGLTRVVSDLILDAQIKPDLVREHLQWIEESTDKLNELVAKLRDRKAA